MNTKPVKQAILAMLFICPGIINAQFNTIRKKDFIGYELLSSKETNTNHIINQDIDTIQPIYNDGEIPDTLFTAEPEKSRKNEVVRKKHLDYYKKYPANLTDESLPELTIPNLLAEIRKNRIHHEKVVFAQAILETGWFRSSVCRNKNNLFGLTNPRTGKYYEFKHWTESVRAYYTKVQYKYKEGNYLLWLDKIGYAEDPRYIYSLINILRQMYPKR